MTVQIPHDIKGDPLIISKVTCTWPGALNHVMNMNPSGAVALTGAWRRGRMCCTFIVNLSQGADTSQCSPSSP